MNAEEEKEKKNENERERSIIFSLLSPSFLGSLNCVYMSSCFLALYHPNKTCSASIQSFFPFFPSPLSPSFLQNPGHGIVVH